MMLIEKLENEVTNLLELRANEERGSLGYVFMGHHVAAIRHAIDIVNEHSDWISVDDYHKQPKGDLFLIYSNKGETLISHTLKYKFLHNDEKVTHWCELPNPPREVV